MVQAIYQGPTNTWGVEMRSQEVVDDAAWVLRRHADRMHALLGENTTLTTTKTLEGEFKKYNIAGQAEA